MAFSDAKAETVSEILRRGSRMGVWMARYAHRLMDIVKMLSDLRSQRAQIEEAILALERLASGQGRRGGRPPKWMAASSSGGLQESSMRKRSPFSAATRAKMASQRRRWPARKKAAA